MEIGNGLVLLFALPTIASPAILVWLNRDHAKERLEDKLSAKKLLDVNVENGATLNVIHTLVNSNMTSEMQSNLDSKREILALLSEAIELKRTAGAEPTQAALDAVAAARGKITELEVQLNDRLKQAKEIEEIQNETMMAGLRKEAAA